MQYTNILREQAAPRQWTESSAPVTVRKPHAPQAAQQVIGESNAIRNIMQLAAKVAPSESTVLILGETGTGKELIAGAIHHQSPRCSKPMIKINCGALPPSLIESELFGYEKGAFTGAQERRIGRFEQACGGTLFLDEIGEMPPELQVKLLRVLQEKELERIGGRTTIRVNIRIIAATNRDLEKEMLAGRFRPDLFYRLNVFPITIPPLRERRSDIPALAEHFLRYYCLRENKNISGIPPAYLNTLINYHWPGNIRELENIIARNVVLSNMHTLYETFPGASNTHTHAHEQCSGIKSITQNEKEHIVKALITCNHKVYGTNGAAALLQINPSTLLSRMKKLGIRRKFSL